MELWVVTVGLYENESVIGVATSKDKADAMVIRARLSGRYSHIETFGGTDDTYQTQGPFKSGELYDWKGVES